MEKNEEKNEVSVGSKIDDILTPAKLRDFGSGESGEVVRLVDIEQTKVILSELALKHKGFVVTKDNYKKEGAEIERELRSCRYALQRIHKSNNKILNDVKKAEKEVYDDLISITEAVEKDIYNQIASIKELVSKEKEEKERIEKERIEKIEGLIRDYERRFEKLILIGRNAEDVSNYESMLVEVEGRMKDFEEFEFQAKRLCAVYSGRKSELLKQVELFEKERLEKEEFEKQKREEAEKKRLEEEKLEENKGKITKIRTSQLVALGFKEDISGCIYGGVGFIEFDEIKSFTELEWFDKLEELKGSIESYLKKKVEQDELLLLSIIKEWDEVVDIFKSFGGNSKLWELKKNEVPTSEKVEKLKVATKQLQEERKLMKLESVRNDIEPFKNDILKFCSDTEKKIKKARFDNDESKGILINLIKRFEDVGNEVLGDVINCK